MDGGKPGGSSENCGKRTDFCKRKANLESYSRLSLGKNLQLYKWGRVSIKGYRINRKNLKLNYFYNLSYQILSILTPLITAPHISRAFGPEGIGVYSYAESIVSYFVLFAALGVPSFAQREIAYSQNDIKKRSDVFWNVKAFSTITVFVSLLIYLFFCISQKAGNKIYVLFTLSIVNILLDVSWLYQGMEEFGVITLRNVILKLINVLFILIFINRREDLVLYTLGNMLISVAGCLSLWPNLTKYIDKPDFKRLRPFYYVKEIMALFIPTIAMQIYLVLDKTMIGIITGNACENGYYEQAMKLSRVAQVLVTSIAIVLLPRVGHFFQLRDKKQIDNLMQNGLRFTFFLGIPICLGLMSVASHFVPWFYGKDFMKVISLIQVLSLLIIVIGINSITGGVYLIATRQEKQYTKSVIVGAVVNFFLNSILIARYQAVGAAAASVIAESSIAAVQLVMIRHDVNWLAALKKSWKYFIAGALMYLLLRYEKLYLEPSVASLFCLIVSGASVYFLLLGVLKDSFFIDNIKNILTKIEKKV